MLHPTRYIRQQTSGKQHVCMYVTTTLFMHMSESCDTTHAASFHATVSITLLIPPVQMPARSLKNTRSDIFQSPQ
jgi:hypothetical protein